MRSKRFPTPSFEAPPLGAREAVPHQNDFVRQDYRAPYARADGHDLFGIHRCNRPDLTHRTTRASCQITPHHTTPPPLA